MAAPFIPGSAAPATTKVELSISARNLQGSDVLSKSDPMCVTYVQPFGTKEWIEHHRTETITNNHNPDFTSKVLIPYRFEEQQPLKFELYDMDSYSQSLKDHDFLGFAVCNLAQIISGGTVNLQLQMRTDYGKLERAPGFLLVTAEELAVNNDEVIMQFSGEHLDKKDWFGKSDPFLEIHRSMETRDFVIVHKTEVIKNTLNPKWKRFFLPLTVLCNADYDRVLKFKCWDWNSSGSHSLIGEFQVTLKELQQNSTTKYPLIHPEKQKKHSYKNSGEIILDFFEIRKVYSFMEFIRGAMQIHCTIAIDFTGSNGDPAHPSSLHFIGGVVPNCYEQAISSVVSIIEDYDSDKQFPVLGFGARLPPDGRISHEFYVNMNPASPYCNGVAGVLDAYRSCIRQVQLYGPTNFTPVIEHVIKFARSYNDGNNYFILLVLTDGVISDMPQTVRAVIEASTLPISIIIVGIGQADFGAMEILDADKGSLHSGGLVAQRDIVQFVPFNKFISQGDHRTARMRLAREVLAEVPRQVVDYMKSNGYVPNPPKVDPISLPPNPEQLY